jgi:hypothetical protein
VDGPALDRAEKDERLVLLDELARVGLGLTGLVVVVQRLEHDLAAVHAAAAVDQVQVGLDAVLHRHAVVVLATLQRDVLADQELVFRDTIGGHRPRQGQGQAAGKQAGQEVFHDGFSFGVGRVTPCLAESAGETAYRLGILCSHASFCLTATPRPKRKPEQCPERAKNNPQCTSTGCWASPL